MPETEKFFSFVNDTAAGLGIGCVVLLVFGFFVDHVFRFGKPSAADEDKKSKK
jgi:hypothetical protein